MRPTISRTLRTSILLAIVLGVCACSTVDRIKQKYFAPDTGTSEARTSDTKKPDTATADTRTAEERAADRAVASQVKAALQADGSVYADHLDIDSKRGVVSLSGWVSSEEEARQVVSDAKAVPGVQRVVDRIERKEDFSHY
jgi:hyperosmotically inducible periplasmic protein